MQTWSCNACGKRFRNERREKISFQKEIWKEYVFEKQTLRELRKKHALDKRTIRDILDAYQSPEKTHFPRNVNLVADALYFGERKEKNSWCAVAFRDQKRKENLWWDFADTETGSLYLKGRNCMESLGYTILSVTGDGFGGLRQAFSPIPFQMCQVHMERIVINGTTLNPQLEAGMALLALVKSLPRFDSQTFKYYLDRYIEKYRNFLNEKTINPLTGVSFFMHDPLRRATLSLLRFSPFLFTFERDKNIPKTSNCLEGHFSHMRDIVEIHRGLERRNKEKVLHSILLASTIAPTEGKLKHIL